MPSIHLGLSLLASALTLILVPAAVPLAARAADSCAILTIGEISSATGDPSIKPGSGINADCIWSGKKTTVFISVRDSGNWSTAKGAFQKYSHIDSVSGLGSDAFFQGAPNPKPTLYALKEAHYIILRVNVAGFSADQTQAALRTLAAAAIGRL
jgi:hypothetical protein